MSEHLHQNVVNYIFFRFQKVCEKTFILLCEIKWICWTSRTTIIQPWHLAPYAVWKIEKCFSTFELHFSQKWYQPSYIFPVRIIFEHRWKTITLVAIWLFYAAAGFVSDRKSTSLSLKGFLLFHAIHVGSYYVISFS